MASMMRRALSARRVARDARAADEPRVCLCHKEEARATRRRIVYGITPDMLFEATREFEWYAVQRNDSLPQKRAAEPAPA